MAAPSFYQVTALAVDGTTASGQRTINTSLMEEIRPASAEEIAKWSTAATTFIYRSIEGNSTRKRTVVTAAVYATVNTAFTA